MTEDDLKRIERDHEGLPGWDDVCELVVEVRRLRELVDDEGSIYLSTAELASTQREMNKRMAAMMERIAERVPEGAEPNPETAAF